MSFPYHKEPDGNRFALHHNYTGYLLVVLGLALEVPDPIHLAALLAGIVAGVGGMLALWTTKGPLIGATVTVLGGFITLTAGILTSSTIIVIGALIALDDAIQHATGVPTPLDWLWKNGLKDLLYMIPLFPTVYEGTKDLLERTLERVF